MTNLKARRDELIAEFQKDKEYLEGYLWFYTAGFDAAIAELRPEIDKLVKALEKFVVKVEHEYCGCNSCDGKNALTKFKEFMGDGE